MAVSKGKTDKYANLAAIVMEMSAANTLTFAKFDFPFSIMDKVGLLISKIEYFVTGLANLDSHGDQAVCGLTVSPNTPTLLNPEDPTIIDSMRVVRLDYGTAGNALLDYQPHIRTFDSLPGGGLIVAPNPLYVAMQSSGCSVAMGCHFRMYYTIMELSTDDYWQLVESRRIVTN